MAKNSELRAYQQIVLSINGKDLNSQEKEILQEEL